MKNLKTLGRRAAAVTCAALLATSLMAPAAFADPAASESSGLAAAYKGTTYRVTVYSGNQGTFADGETQVVFEDQKPGDTFSFEGITLEVPESSQVLRQGCAPGRAGQRAVRQEPRWQEHRRHRDAPVRQRRCRREARG